MKWNKKRGLFRIEPKARGLKSVTTVKRRGIKCEKKIAILLPRKKDYFTKFFGIKNN